MSHILKQSKGFLRTIDSDNKDVKKPIPLYRQTIIPKNKYSKMYQEAKEHLQEVDSYGNPIRGV
jgi:hypothetical protein